MQPSVTLVRSFENPPHTFRASRTEEMYILNWSQHLAHTYHVGVEPTDVVRELTVTNRTVSHDLKVTVRGPEWLTISHPEFIVPKNTSHVIRVSLIEADAIEKSKAGTFITEKTVDVEVTPLLVNGPVFVSLISL